MLVFSGSLLSTLLAAALLCMCAHVTAQTDPSLIVLQGGGCDNAQTSVTKYNAGESVSLSFPAYSASLSGGSSFARNTCVFSMPIVVPQGRALSLLRAAYTGSAALPSAVNSSSSSGGGTSGSLTGDYFFGVSTGDHMKLSWPDPSGVLSAAGRFSFTHDVSDSAREYTACGAQTTVRLNTALLLRQLSGGAAAADSTAQLTVHSVTFSYAFSSCSAAPCAAGFAVSLDSGTCADLNECANNNGGCSGTDTPVCVNTPGSFVCAAQCAAGYEHSTAPVADPKQCTDVNECSTLNGGCSLSPAVDCINTPGSFKCAPCPFGYQGDGVTCTAITCPALPSSANYSLQCTGEGLGDTCHVTCAQGYQLVSDTDTTNCSEHGTWTEPLPRCTAVPVNACATNDGGCSPYATCSSTSGVVTCSCADGFSGDGVWCVPLAVRVLELVVSANCPLGSVKLSTLLGTDDVKQSVRLVFSLSGVFRTTVQAAKSSDSVQCDLLARLLLLRSPDNSTAPLSVTQAAYSLSFALRNRTDQATVTTNVFFAGETDNKRKHTFTGVQEVSALPTVDSLSVPAPVPSTANSSARLSSKQSQARLQQAQSNSTSAVSPQYDEQLLHTTLSLIIRKQPGSASYIAFDTSDALVLVMTPTN